MKCIDFRGIVEKDPFLDISIDRGADPAKEISHGLCYDNYAHSYYLGSIHPKQKQPQDKFSIQFYIQEKE